jgi:hypothetical protein
MTSADMMSWMGPTDSFAQKRHDSRGVTWSAVEGRSSGEGISSVTVVGWHGRWRRGGVAWLVEGRRGVAAPIRERKEMVEKE